MRPHLTWRSCVVAGMAIAFVGAWSFSTEARLPQQTANRGRGRELSMKWMFSKGAGPLTEVGGVGSQGEFYFVPSKKATLKAPEGTQEKMPERVFPIFPRNQVLSSVGEEYIGVYEMRYRQLLNDVGQGGVFGHVYYSPENSKLALVGTLALIKKIERLDDGGLYVLLEGVGRFYIRDILNEKPYLKARAQMFNDWAESEASAADLEQKVLDEVRISVKVMKLLYPQNNYTLNHNVLKNRPPTRTPGSRIVKLPGAETELQRRSKFSFAVMDMLKTDPVTKVLFLQETVVEKRYTNMLKVLADSTSFLEGELRKRGVITESGLAKMREEAVADLSDLTPPQEPLQLYPDDAFSSSNFQSLGPIEM